MKHIFVEWKKRARVALLPSLNYASGWCALPPSLSRLRLLPLAGAVEFRVVYMYTLAKILLFAKLLCTLYMRDGDCLSNFYCLQMPFPWSMCAWCACVCMKASCLQIVLKWATTFGVKFYHFHRFLSPPPLSWIVPHRRHCERDRTFSHLHISLSMCVSTFCHRVCAPNKSQMWFTFYAIVFYDSVKKSNDWKVLGYHKSVGVGDRNQINIFINKTMAKWMRKGREGG